MCITWLMAVQYCLESESDNQVTFFFKVGGGGGGVRGGVCEGWGVTCVIRSELTHVCNPITDVLRGFVWFCTILCCLLSCIVVGHMFPSGEIAHKKQKQKHNYYYHCNVNELALPCIHAQAFTAHARASVHSMHITALIHRC